MQKTPFLVIAGPTASGKSELAIRLAKALDGEIISADSMQVYRHLDIGTAKQMPEERAGIPHHLLDVADPMDRFTLADYLALAREQLEKIQARGKTAIFCGGTGLYLDFILEGLELEVEEEGAKEKREALRRRLLAEGLGNAHARLKALDPEAGETIQPQDEKRIVRFFERYEKTGLTQTEHDAMTRAKALDPGPFLAFTLDWDRAVLYERINRRAESLFQTGLIEESTMLHLAYPDFQDSQAYQAIAYKEAHKLVTGEGSLDTAVTTLQQATRNFAKRQISWFKRKDYYKKISPEGSFEKILTEFNEKF